MVGCYGLAVKPARALAAPPLAELAEYGVVKTLAATTPQVQDPFHLGELTIRA
jgi:hypothetical protein